MDPATISAAVMAGGSLLGGLFNGAGNAISAQQQYQMNMAMQKQSQKWQEKMSNTAFQRQKKDLIKAGYNPLMALGASGGGASTGSSPTPGVSAPDYSGIGAGIQNAVNTAMQNKLTNAQVNNLFEQSLTELSKRNNLDANSALQWAQEKLTNLQTEWMPKKWQNEINELRSNILLNTGKLAEVNSATALNNAMNNLYNEQRLNWKLRNQHFGQTYKSGESLENSFNIGLKGVGGKSGYSNNYGIIY